MPKTVLVAFRIKPETLQALKEYHQKMRSKTWDGTFTALLNAIPPGTIIMHSIKELPNCKHRLVACSKKFSNIKLTDCLTCTMKEEIYGFTY